jgi:hypothetical protein
MRIQTYNLICNTFFWIKTFFALLIGLGGLSYLSYEIYRLNKEAYADPFIDLSLVGGDSAAAILEPPGIYAYLGYSINWYQTEPLKFSLNGNRPIL